MKGDNTMKLLYPAIFTPFDDGEGYTVEFPDLPGCVTEGDSLIEAIEMAVDAASGWVLGELEEGKQIPGASNPTTIKHSKGSLVNMIILDMDSYAEKYGSKTIRKNITIPAWLNTYGEKNNINFSRVLSDALLRQVQR
jgi:predicted RNase H-like HicB family nuclease